MTKEQRFSEIIRMLNQSGIIRNSEIIEKLKVSDMTVRRDLTELENMGYLVKVHGGARGKNVYNYKELSHDDKHTINSEAKDVIAHKALNLIEEGDTIFLGPGTTTEKLASLINNKVIRIVTNCLPIFQLLLPKVSSTFKVYLVAGEYREVTKCFFGDLSNIVLSKLHYSKIFFSANGVKGDEIMTSTFEETYTQKIAINNSEKKYLLLDSSKIGKEDFSTFYNLSNIDAVIMEECDERKKRIIKEYTEVI